MKWTLRVRQVANLVNGSTVLGAGLAVAAGSTLSHGAHGIVLAQGYRWRFPQAGAFTVGNVVIFPRGTSASVEDPVLMGHEARHCTQYAWCLGLGFLPLYGLCAAWSVLRTGNPATANFFERHAGLEAGGYLKEVSNV